MTNASTPPDWVKELTAENFLAIYDVVLDIRQEIQLSDNPMIPLLQQIIKFPPLLPRDSISMRDRYCDLRWKATGLLKQHGVIRGYDLLQSSHRWKSRLRIECDRTTLEEFVRKLNEENDRRRLRVYGNSGYEQSRTSLDSMETLRNILIRFHTVVIQLRQRHNRRPTLDVADEYDVQDSLHALLRLHFDDIRPEEWTPSYAGKSARVDFLLKPEAMLVEVKKTRVGLSEKEVGDQLIVDIARYAKMTECKTLVCFVYDPESRIVNPGGLEADLSGSREGMKIEILILPKRY